MLRRGGPAPSPPHTTGRSSSAHSSLLLLADRGVLSSVIRPPRTLFQISVVLLSAERAVVVVEVSVPLSRRSSLEHAVVRVGGPPRTPVVCVVLIDALLAPWRIWPVRRLATVLLIADTRREVHRADHVTNPTLQIAFVPHPLGGRPLLLAHPRSFSGASRATRAARIRPVC